MKKKTFYVLTNPQNSIWLTEQYFPNTSINNLGGSLTILETVDFSALEKAFNIFIEKNDSFRLRFTVTDTSVNQYIADFENFPISIINVENEDDIKKIENELINTPFELIDSKLFRLVFFKYKDGHGGFSMSIHHLISDAWSFALLIDEIISIYSSLINNQMPSISLPSYLDYVASECDYLNSNKFQKDKLFWENLFSNIPEIAKLPSSKGNINFSVDSKRKQFYLSSEMLNKINNFCVQNKISVYNFLMAIFSIYIGKCTNLNDFVIGTPVLNRGNFNEKHTTGMFISMIPYRVSLNQESSFLNFVKLSANNFFSIFRHQKYPYEAILEYIRKSDSSVPNLYDIVISYQNMRTNRPNESINYTSHWTANNSLSSSLEIHFFDVNNDGVLNIAYDYQTSKYNKSDINSMHERILFIINQVLNNSEILLKDICITTPMESKKILFDFNNTKVDYCVQKTIVSLFEEQAIKTPDRVAIVDTNTSITYKELNEKANILANLLINKGVKPNNIIGIILNRSIDLMISIIGVLKSGAAYLPIDPEYPVSRISYMLEDSSCPTIISSSKIINKFSLAHDSILIDNLSGNSVFKSVASPNNLAYVIYTSGSTGTPKGVLLKHQSLSNLANYCNHYIEYLKENIYYTIVSVTTVSFDIFIFETLISLQKGLKLVIANENEQNIPRLLNELIEKNSIQIIQTTPSRMQLLLDNLSDIPFLKNLKYITLAGEPLPIQLSKKLHELSEATIYNGYGPSETTVFSTLTNVTNYEKMTIGKPLDNTQIYILHDNNCICPTYVPGEIYISGDGVGYGYLNRKDLTEKAFLKNPFLPGQIMYKTGDLGYFQDNGEIVCLGRTDSQVKIRGLRIELQEIENKLLQIPFISKCAVIKMCDENNHEFLCAYYTTSKEIQISEIRSHLQKYLPVYMVPQYFIMMDDLPYTPNGKINKKALPLPNFSKNNKEILKPRNNLDETLITILKNLLKCENIGINESFFELGGDSLSAINLCTQIYSKLKIQITVKDILENPIIMNLSDLISTYSQNYKEHIISHAPISNFYPLSTAQKRVYYASKMDEENLLLYNMAGGVVFEKIPNIDKLNYALNVLFKRHESFRTYFTMINEQVVQKINSDINFELEIKNLDYNFEANLLDNLFQSIVTPFSLEHAPLVKAHLIIYKDQKAVFILNMHHIISDGLSIKIFIEELCKLYNDENLPQISFTYKDYSFWENSKAHEKELDKSKNFWLSQFDGCLPILNMPTTYPRPINKSYKGKKIYFEIDSYLTSKIISLCNELNVTPYMFFLSAYYLLLSKYTGQEDIIIGSPVTCRNFKEFENVIGMFVNSLALRCNFSQDYTFENLTQKIKNLCVKSFEHKLYPFDILVKNLNINRTTNRNPLFDTMFTYQNSGNTQVNFKNIPSHFLNYDLGISKFDFSLEVTPENDYFKLCLEYSTDLFDNDFMLHLSNHYINILKNVVKTPSSMLKDITILTSEEENQILKEFNNTFLSYPKEKTIIDLFEEQVKNTPDDIAIVFENSSITYKELNYKANSIAFYLRNIGIKPNDIVGIMQNRSLELVISMIGILKAGGAYLPIDPSYPENRINYIINNSNMFCLLSQNNIKKSNINLETIINVDLDSFEPYKNLSNVANPENINTPDDLAYLIYTSGSTGNPKGVMLTHRNVVNFIFGTCNKINFKNKSIVSVTTMCFDIFVLETLLPLCIGTKIVLANEDEQNLPYELNKLCIKYGVNMIQTTPSRMNLLLDDSSSLEYLSNITDIMLGGERFPEQLLEKIKKLTKANIYNMYGPTETTVWSSVKDLTNTNYITIGKPIANTQMFILDKNLKLLPVGIPGTLYIGGDGISKGYYNNEILTNEKFINCNYIDGNKIYNTGDLAKFLPNGELMYIGRTDFQVKFHGLRIELEEIENAIISFKNIQKVVVAVKNINQREFLCAYFIANGRISTSMLKNHLLKKLPNYMIPAFLIQMTNFIYTPNGKIDKNALPVPNFSKIANIINFPKTITEKKLEKIWKKLLSIDTISTDDNFFEIGGDSILALNMQIELMKIGINITYSDIFKFSTIENLAKIIDSKKSENSITSYPENDFTCINKFLQNNNTLSLKNIKYNAIGNVLLTGSTGYLGIHILEELIKINNITIYCAIRKDPSTSPTQKLKQKLNYYFGNKYDHLIGCKIKIIDSDITKEKFGLSDKEYNDLGNNITSVINSAAIVKHYGNYSDFEKINVIGVQNLITFCEKFNKEFIQISTTSVSGNTFTDLGSFSIKSNKNTIFDEKSLFINQSLENVYVRSKFEAEKIILKELECKKLKGIILRVGNITNRYKDGKFQINSRENAFLNRIKAFLSLKIIPDYMENMYIEFTPVDCLANAIIKSIQYYNNCISVLHLYNPNHLYLKNFINILNTLYGKNEIKIINEKDFEKNIKNMFSNPKLFEEIGILVNDLNKESKLVYESSIKIKNKFSLMFLNSIKFTWPKIDLEYISKLLKNLN